MKDSYKLFQVKKIGAKGRRRQESFILAEKSAALFSNDQEVITFLATPENLKELAVALRGLAHRKQASGEGRCRPEGGVCLRTKYVRRRKWPAGMNYPYRVYSRQANENFIPRRTGDPLRERLRFVYSWRNPERGWISHEPEEWLQKANF